MRIMLAALVMAAALLSASPGEARRSRYLSDAGAATRCGCSHGFGRRVSSTDPMLRYLHLGRSRRGW